MLLLSWEADLSTHPALWAAPVLAAATLVTACAKSSEPMPPVAADPTVTLSGAAAEAAPNAHMLAGVRIQVTDGPDAGKAVTSDAAGEFRFAALRPGAIGLLASKDGFLPWRVLNLSVETYPQIQVVMYPVPPTNARGVAATARCNDGSWSWDDVFANLCVGHGGTAYAVCPGPLCVGGRP